MSSNVVLNFERNQITLDFVPDRVVVAGVSGPTGPANTLTIGTVTTVAAGGSATAAVGGTAPNQTLSLGIPIGLTGATNTLTIGTVTTVAAGGSATASIGGTAPNQTLSMGIPTGATGATGPANTLTIGTVTTVAAGGSATASVGGTAPNQTVSFGLPTGATGATGDWSTAQTLNAQTGTSYALVAGDVGKLVTLENGAAVALTVPSGLGLTAGQRIDLAQLGAGQVTVSGSGATVNSTPTAKLRTQYSAATLICTATNVFLLVGDLAAS